MAQKIDIPGVGSYPLWATEDSLRDLIKAIGGLAPKGGGPSAGQGAGGAKEDPQKASKMLADSLGDVNDESQKLVKRFGSLYDENGKRKFDSLTQSLTAGSINGIKQMTNLAAGLSDIGSVTSLAGGAMIEFAAAAGPLAPLVVAFGSALMLISDLLGQYNKILGEAIDVGLGYSDSLGKAATLAGQSGLALGDFYAAVKEAGQGMRALGFNGEEAAQNFAKMQTEVRNTYGTFGMSNTEMAKASGTFVNLMGAAGHKGATAASLAAESQGKSMNEMRKISIATGISMSKVMGSFKDLFAGRDGALLTASLSKMGQNTAEAAMKLARGASSFEAVFGDLGKDLYKQMKQAAAAGLSIINTTLGAEIAPFVDVRMFEQFAKASEEGGSAMVHASQQFAKSIEPNLATIKLQAATGDKVAMQLLEMYNQSKKFTSMSDDEIAALDSKKRAEERFATLQQKMSAAFEKMYNKLFGFLDLIPNQMIETIADTFEVLADVLGDIIDAVIGVARWFKPLFEIVWASMHALIIVITPLVKTISALAKAIGETLGAIWEFDLDKLGEIWINAFSAIGQSFMEAGEKLWDLITTPFKKVYDWFTGFLDKIGSWFKSSWLGKKLFGDSESSSSSSSGSVLASQGSSAGTTASNAQLTAKANVQADQAKAQSQTSEDMRRLVDINAAQHAQMERVASNTGQTKEAVERNGATY